MKNLLVINSSARIVGSKSRKLTEVFIEHSTKFYPGTIIKSRELANDNVPHITEAWISATSKRLEIRTVSETEILKKSDEYIAELREADIIAIGAPMYNWSIPSTLKAYIDNILRKGETWEFNSSDTEHPYSGLLKNKTLFLLLSRGSFGYKQGEPNFHMDFQSTYLKTIFNIIGINKIHVVTIDGTSSNAEIVDDTIAIACQDLKRLIEKELAENADK